MEEAAAGGVDIGWAGLRYNYAWDRDAAYGVAYSLDGPTGPCDAGIWLCTGASLRQGRGLG